MGAEIGGLTEIVQDGNLLVALVVALAAGFVSFASPCVLPLVPGFLGFVTGSSGQSAAGRSAAGRSAGASPGDLRPLEERPRSTVMLGAALFVAGFSLVFMTGTLLATWAGSFFTRYDDVIMRVGGVVVILLALVFMGVGGAFGTQRTWTPRWRPAAGLAGAPLLGIVFGLGWAPCMGPTLGVIYTLATNLRGDGNLIARGAALGLAYCVGLGVPFLALAAGWSRAARTSAWLRRHHRAVQIGGGLLLLIVGLLLVTGAWTGLVAWVQSSLVSQFRTPL